MPTLVDAIQLALTAHYHQEDKADVPYILHPLRVMFAVHDDEARMAAILHDVVEDSEFTFDTLRCLGYPESVVKAVECLTKRPEEKNDYPAFIKRVKTNPIARRVKIADIEDNLDVRRLEKVTSDDVDRLEKYRLAWTELMSIENGASGETK